MSVLSGVLFHAIGAACATLCYVPQKKTREWSWQTYWLAQAFVCWILLPILIAWLTVPHIMEVIKLAPTSAILKSFFFGAAYGIGGTAFGVSIRYIGFSLTYAIAIGISCVLGTLLPPLVNGQMAALVSQPNVGWVFGGIAIGLVGIALCGQSGWYKENDLALSKNQHTFNYAKGLPVCLLAGVLSALYGFALDQGQPIADIAAAQGAGNYQGNIVYVFANAGAFLTSFSYCLYLHIKKNTFKEYILVVKKKFPLFLAINFLMAGLTGLLWYAQFFFYGLGHVRMGSYKFSSWSIHMIMLVMFSLIAGLALREWSSCSRRTKVSLTWAIIVLLMAVLMITYGNYLGTDIKP